VFYPSTQYKEFNDVGTYFAFLKHHLMVRNWTDLTESKMPPNTEKSEYYISEDNLHIRSQISNLAEITRLDNVIHCVAAGSSLELLDNLMRYPLLEKRETLAEAPFWIQWTKYITSLLQELMLLPESAQNELLRDDLHYVYNEMYERFAERISLSQLHKMLGVRVIGGAKPHEIPFPVQFVDTSPLYTVGQVYECRWTVMSLRQMKGNWQELLSPQVAQTLCFEIEDEGDGDPREQVGEFYHQGYSYYRSLLYTIYDPMTSWEDAVVIAEHLIKRIPNAADVYASIGSKLLYYNEYDRAQTYLEKAEALYQSVLPYDYEGKVDDGNDDYYHFTLLHLGFLNFRKGDYEAARSYLVRAQNATHEWLNFEEIIQQFDEHRDTFEQWYKDEMLTYELFTSLTGEVS
jgi:tetratricopeptide (TPR) repeat protein